MPKPVAVEELAKLLGMLRTQCGMNNRDHTFATPEQSKKLIGRPEPGAHIKIHWPDIETVDRGYIFTLPGYEDDDVYMGGLVHVPEPENPGGMDGVPAEWTTLDELLRNPRVGKITVMRNV